MENDIFKSGYYRISKLLMNLIDSEDKNNTIKIARNLLEESLDFINLMYLKNKVSKEDVENFEKEVEKEELEFLEVEKEETVAKEEAPKEEVINIEDLEEKKEDD